MRQEVFMKPILKRKIRIDKSIKVKDPKSLRSRVFDKLSYYISKFGEGLFIDNKTYTFRMYNEGMHLNTIFKSDSDIYVKKVA